MIYREDITTYKRLVNGYKPITQNKINILSVQYFLLCIFAFFAGRVIMLRALMPFGIAFFIASTSLLKKEKCVLTGCITLVGYISLLKGYVSISHAITLAILMIVAALVNVKGKHITLKLSAAAFIINTFVSVAINAKFVSGTITLYDVILALLESFVIVASAYIFTFGMPVLFENDRRKVLSREEIIFISIMMSIVVAGMWDIRYMGLSLRNIIAFFIVLISGYMEGSAMGAALGVTLGIISSLSSVSMPTSLGIYAFCGLVAGLFKDLGKLISALAFVISAAIISFYISGFSSAQTIFLDALVPAILFIIIPQKKYLKLAFLIDGDKRTIELQRLYIERVKDVLGVKLESVTNTLTGLSDILEKNIDNELARKSEINGMVEKLADKVCQNCDSRNLCWKRELYYTYDGLVELLSHIEKNGKISIMEMPQNLKRKCIKPNELTKQANYIFEVFRLNNRWRKKLINSKTIVAEQIKGVSELVNSMMGEVTTTTEFKSDVEQEIAVALDRKGIDFDDILAVKNSRDKYEVTIYRKPCEGKQLCAKEFSGVVSTVLGVNVVRDNNKCKMNKECSMCQFRLIEAENYNIITAISKMPKEKVSGDSCIYGGIGEGRYMLALSDGMGSGPQAAAESDTTISLLEKFMEAGFERNTAIKAINSALVLRSCEESFATVDMGLIDMYSGIGEFIKIGSAPTFIKSGNHIDTITSTSLPVGILDEIDVESQIVELKNGDMIIMVTDGVIDASEDKERWIVKALREFDSGNPKDISDYLLNKAKAFYGEDIGDDMTVIVSKIWKVM